MSDLPPAGNDSNDSTTPASGDVAVVGESTAATKVSIQTLQGIYNELTGKTEEVGKSYDRPIRLTFEDLLHLNSSLYHACEQYNVATANCSVTVYYIDDSKDTFSSFDRFKLHSTGSVSAVESVLLTYNFLITLPKTLQAQSYSLTVRVASRIAVMKKMQADFMAPPARIFRIMGSRTAVVSVKYVDYMVARNLLRVVDEWIHGVPVATEHKWLRWITTRSEHIPRVVRFAMALFVSYLVIKLIPIYVQPAPVNLLAFAYFSAYALVGVFAAYRISGYVAGFIEEAVDSWLELSYLRITRGDEQEIQNAQAANNREVAKGIAGFLLAVATGVVANIIANSLVLGSIG